MAGINFNYKAITRIMGVIILIEGLFMLIPWIYAELNGDISAAYAFRRCVPVTVIIGAAIPFIVKSAKSKFRQREGYIVVALCWVMASVVGAFPYYLSGFAENFIDAIFESTSGFTTTGCTAISGKLLTRSLMLWKALSNWLGGMGILLLVISILPALGINGQTIAKTETPGPVLEKMTVRMSDSAKILYITYLSFTVIEFILLVISSKMPVFDAVINTMGSISTGGLTVHSTGIAYYNSVYVEIVMSVFCLLASFNFIMYHYAITGKFSMIFKDLELRVFLIMILAAIAICTISFVTTHDVTLKEALRESFFQVVSTSTTAGYTRSPYIQWPSMCKLILIALMFTGGCAASTSGSIKVIRIIILCKLIWRGCIKRIHPRSVVAVKVSRRTVSAPVVSGITVFILTYMMIFLLASFVLSFQGLDFETTLTSALAMLSNTGSAFGETASLGNFSIFHPALKLFLSALMIVGRLELFPIIVLFTRNFWGYDR